MEYTVDITLRTKQPLTQDELFDIAQIGGVAVGRAGERILEARLTVIAPDAARALQQAVRLITLRVRREPLAIECKIVAAPSARAARRPASRSADAPPAARTRMKRRRRALRTRRPRDARICVRKRMRQRFLVQETSGHVSCSK